MMKASAFLIIGSVFFLSSHLILAEQEDHKGETSKVQSGTQHKNDDTRTVRDGETTYVKRLLEDGIQTTTGGITFTHRFTDFVGRQNITDGRGRIVIPHLPDRQDEVVRAARRLGFRLELRSNNFILCSFDVRNVTLRQIQEIFFNPAVRYAEPDPERGIQR